MMSNRRYEVEFQLRGSSKITRAKAEYCDQTRSFRILDYFDENGIREGLLVQDRKAYDLMCERRNGVVNFQEVVTGGYFQSVLKEATLFNLVSGDKYAIDTRGRRAVFREQEQLEAILDRRLFADLYLIMYLKDQSGIIEMAYINMGKKIHTQLDVFQRLKNKNFVFAVQKKDNSYSVYDPSRSELGMQHVSCESWKEKFSSTPVNCFTLESASIITPDKKKQQGYLVQFMEERFLK